MQDFASYYLFFCAIKITFYQNHLVQTTNLTVNDLNLTQLSNYQKVANSEVAASVWIAQASNFSNQVSDQLLEIPLLGTDVTCAYRAKYIWVEPNGNLAWFGELESNSSNVPLDGYASFSIIDGELWGAFMAGETDYALMDIGDGLYALVLVEETAPPVCGFAVGHQEHELFQQNVPANAQDRECNVVVKVLILHTQRASEAIKIDAKTRQNLIVNVNQALLNSGIQNHELVFVLAGGGQLENFLESSDIASDWNSLLNSNVAGIRSSTAADLVVLLTDGDYSSNGSRIYGYAPSCDPAAPFAYCIVEAEQSATRMTFAHEIAHLFGCKHSPNNANGGCEPAYERPHWFNYNGGERHTIMEAGIKKNWRIPHFSNPEVYWKGYPTGTLNNPPTEVERNNARKLRERACAVAAFRFSLDFNVSIKGDNKICEYETDSPYGYFADASDGFPGQYSYFWEISSDGINYTSPPNNTDSGIDFDYSSLQGGDKIFIRVRVTDGATSRNTHT